MNSTKVCIMREFREFSDQWFTPLLSPPRFQGIADTAQTIYETAAREHESRGVTGAVGEVLRQIPPAVVKPLIVATEATSSVLGGMRNQIRPDVRQDESQKWRHGEDWHFRRDSLWR